MTPGQRISAIFNEAEERRRESLTPEQLELLDAYDRASVREHETARDPRVPQLLKVEIALAANAARAACLAAGVPRERL
ncbi:MAG: hypothetical protein SFV15_16795 [Polyangiaceae bacterium]|nr:hypothetical protein [Polyangiaceae bacterium]